jgi:hypothetical protein
MSQPCCFGARHHRMVARFVFFATDLTSCISSQHSLLPVGLGSQAILWEAPCKYADFRWYFHILNFLVQRPIAISLGATSFLELISFVQPKRQFICTSDWKYTRSLMEPGKEVSSLRSDSRIFSTYSASWGYMHVFNTCSSHSRRPCFISCDTHLSLDLPFLRLIFSDGGLGIHGSRQICTFVPELTRHMIPFLRSSGPYSMAFHVGDESVGNTVSTNSPQG